MHYCIASRVVTGKLQCTPATTEIPEHTQASGPQTEQIKGTFTKAVGLSGSLRSPSVTVLVLTITSRPANFPYPAPDC